jgi:hypothetical protein
LVDLYDLDELRAADFQGEVRWVIRQGAEWLYGGAVGGVLADVILSTWNTDYLGPPSEWA